MNWAVSRAVVFPSFAMHDSLCGPHGFQNSANFLVLYLAVILWASQVWKKRSQKNTSSLMYSFRAAIVAVAPVHFPSITTPSPVTLAWTIGSDFLPRVCVGREISRNPTRSFEQNLQIKFLTGIWIRRETQQERVNSTEHSPFRTNQR